MSRVLHHCITSTTHVLGSQPLYNVTNSRPWFSTIGGFLPFSLGSSPFYCCTEMTRGVSQGGHNRKKCYHNLVQTVPCPGFSPNHKGSMSANLERHKNIATAIRSAKISPSMTQDLGECYLRDTVI